MRFPFHRILVLTLCFLTLGLAGCDSGSDGDFVDSGEPTATITYNTILAKAVPSSVVRYRFTGTDASNSPVYGPALAAKQPSITLIVPRTLVNLTVEYLDANNAVVGIVDVDVNLSGGQNVTITDPDFASPGGDAAQVSFLVGPTAVGEGTAISPAITVEIEDANGATVTTSSAPVTLSLGSNPGNSTLSGTLTVAAVNGVATFSDISLDNAGNAYTLIASSAGLTSDTSAAFNVLAPGNPAKLAFQGTPANTAAGTAITGVTVLVQDANGLTVTTADTLITVALGNNAGNGTLEGSLQVAAVDGVASFNDLTIDAAGVGYTLTAEAANLTGATSAAFDITSAP
jgi:hypothetical protein